jgi:hypothetical protein
MNTDRTHMPDSHATWWLAAGVIIVLMVLLAQTSDAQRVRPRDAADNAPEAGEGERSFADYRLLVQRNIFSSTRRPPSRWVAPEPEPETAPARPPEPEPEPDPAGLWVLRGTLVTDGGPVAIIEQASTGELRWISTDERVCERQVEQIGLEGLLLVDEQGERVEVAVGCLLTGAVAGEAGPVSSTSATSSSSDDRPSANPALEAIRERMRRARARQNGVD